MKRTKHVTLKTILNYRCSWMLISPLESEHIVSTSMRTVDITIATPYIVECLFLALMLNDWCSCVSGASQRVRRDAQEKTTLQSMISNECTDLSHHLQMNDKSNQRKLHSYVLTTHPSQLVFFYNEWRMIIIRLEYNEMVHLKLIYKSQN